MLFLVLIFGIVFATGFDVTQLASKLFSRGDASASVASAEPMIPVASGSTGFSLSITGPGGWKTAVILLAVILGIAGIALSVLSANGRDAAWMKEQEAKKKKDQKSTPAAKAAAAPCEPGDEECNLASYKLFFPSSAGTATPNQTPTASTPV